MNHKNLEIIFIYLGENIKIETKLTFKFAETFHFCFRDSANFQFFNKTFFFNFSLHRISKNLENKLE